MLVKLMFYWDRFVCPNKTRTFDSNPFDLNILKIKVIN